jgi:hypothetical protein
MPFFNPNFIRTARHLLSEAICGIPISGPSESRIHRMRRMPFFNPDFIRTSRHLLSEALCGIPISCPSESAIHRMHRMPFFNPDFIRTSRHLLSEALCVIPSPAPPNLRFTECAGCRFSIPTLSGPPPIHPPKPSASYSAPFAWRHPLVVISCAERSIRTTSRMLQCSEWQ